ncbi:Gfo/Idh/MocA family protein [Herbiconiux sp. L3-i23]|uniref:Gfo/Idh/MocA family protein n=1 Tax=Herbiconiux sp. L3-i23 TaxID=2905871 RepID=UPI0020565036|nr:Gfo/Idh/MocA family oxidoreductase [Herbiconiux sp. L3-i23]BDI23491.1 oxidoreductase [Herbiconiux sp. L3-i23]
MTDAPIRVGIVGCGEITQLMHLPFLDESPNFVVIALCDLSEGTAKGLAARYRVPKVYTDSGELAADPDVDAVFVCSYDHAGVALQAIAAGKHVLVEKPLAFTPAEGREVAAAAASAGVVAMVGYMKLFDPGFRSGLDLIAAGGPVRRKQMHNLAGRFDSYRSYYDQLRVHDIPDGVLERSKQEVDERIADHLGEHGEWTELYTMLLMLGAHDLAVIREAFGEPVGVPFATSRGQNELTAIVDYPDGVPLVFEIGVGTRYDWWDEWLAVDSDTAQVRVDFSHPYIKYSTTDVALRESRDGNESRATIIPPALDPFRVELAHFADAIRNGTPVRSTIEGGLQDLELATALITALPPRPPRSGSGDEES